MSESQFTEDQRDQFMQWSKQRAEREARDRYPDSEPLKRRAWAEDQTMRYFRQYIGADQ